MSELEPDLFLGKETYSVAFGSGKSGCESIFYDTVAGRVRSSSSPCTPPSPTAARAILIPQAAVVSSLERNYTSLPIP